MDLVGSGTKEITFAALKQYPASFNLKLLSCKKNPVNPKNFRYINCKINCLETQKTPQVPT